ncbi:conserved Plasmodium protein, unknown function [Plasmodium chabaudi adami]|uniref:Mitochondrial carrier protein n=1 Tax=Plasmodium chabaudi adami TaxID=5826 RepID=A0A1C6X7U5_PLACE|nr:conserved Plasmodium protein, unknown function [Plasmodium chabaudi adami]
MLIQKYDEKPKFDIGISPLYLISYPIYNIQCRSILYKYLNVSNDHIKYNQPIHVNNLNIKTYIIYIINSLQQIYNNEGVTGLYSGLVPMVAHLVSKKSIYYFLENIHFYISRKLRRGKKKDTIDKKDTAARESRFLSEKENSNNFIGDNINFNIVKHMIFVKDENDFVKKKKKKDNFHLSFYHTFYEYISCIISYPLLNISTKLIIFEDHTKSLLQNLKDIIHFTYVYDGMHGFFRGINNYLIIQSVDKFLNCFLYKKFSNNCSYDKVLTIKVVLSTCLNTIMAPYIHYSILDRSQSHIPTLCRDTTFSQFFCNFHWKSHLSNVSVGLAVAGIQLIIIALMPKDASKNDELVDQEPDEYV